MDVSCFRLSLLRNDGSEYQTDFDDGRWGTAVTCEQGGEFPATSMEEKKTEKQELAMVKEPYYNVNDHPKPWSCKAFLPL